MTNAKEITVDEAVSAIRADYYGDVRDMAKNLAERMKAGDVEDFSDALHDAVDDCQRCIYTFQAKLGLLASDNEDAMEEELGDDNGTPEQRMYWALRADIVEHLEACHVDVNDPDSWAEIDMSEFE